MLAEAVFLEIPFSAIKLKSSRFGPPPTKDLVQQVEFLLNALIQGKPTQAAVIAAVEKVSPAIAEISRKTVSNTEYAAWIAIVISLLTLFKDIHLGYFKKEDKTPINQEFVDYLLKENAELKKEQSNISTSKATKKATTTVSRNELCPCGSGKKFKKCHGFR